MKRQGTEWYLINNIKIISDKEVLVNNKKMSLKEALEDDEAKNLLQLIKTAFDAQEKIAFFSSLVREMGNDVFFTFMEILQYLSPNTAFGEFPFSEQDHSYHIDYSDWCSFDLYSKYYTSMKNRLGLSIVKLSQALRILEKEAGLIEIKKVKESNLPVTTYIKLNPHWMSLLAIRMSGNTNINMATINKPL